jgi:RNA polymerase sigma factor (sigma-70 family)
MDDMKFLRDWVERGSEDSFRTLVDRHLNMVYCAARRLVPSSHQAEEVTQTVFVILAKKASGLSMHTVLAGWLYRTTRYTAAQMIRMECRRQQRVEGLTALDEAPSDSLWTQIAPHLEEAMGDLGPTDRNAIVLRFLEEKSLAEVGQALQVSEDAARKRVNRALEKLRGIFVKRGVVVTSTLLISALSANSVQAVPAGLAASVVANASAKGAAIAISTLVKGTLKLMAWTKIKTVGIATVAILLCSMTTIVVTQKVSGKKIERAGGAANPEPDWIGMVKAAKTPEEKQNIEKMWCLDNLKQVGSAARQRAIAHEGVFPPDFLSLKDHLYSPKCLTCPSDAGKTAVTKWSRLKAANVSYALVSPNLKDTRSNVVIAKCPIHGHVVLSSGQAFQGEYIRQTGMKIKEDNTLE